MDFLRAAENDSGRRTAEANRPQLRQKQPGSLWVAGIDPGTIQTGVGILEQDSHGELRLVCVETIRTKAERAPAGRLREIYDALKVFLTLYLPDVVAIEDVFYRKNFKTSVKIGEARAVAMLAAEELSIPVEEYPPARVKEAVCGNGRADKLQVQFMVKQLLRLKEFSSGDAADALAIAICHAHTNRWNLKKAVAMARK